MNPWGPFVVFLVVGTAWTVAWGWVVAWSSRPSGSFDDIYAAGAVLRRRLFSAIVAILVIVFLVSIRWFPYRSLAEARLGPPAAHVTVTAKMWQWTLSQTEIPAGTPVEFDVTSIDVNHGFGIYGPSGHIVAQVQAMPGYTNRLVVRFSEPGQYLVRCLEFCGIPHIGMAAALQVK
ncbi:MAG TPA: cytochrome c oxidase subunit II [bacterium]|nr:cytochrome c oxidase subunit II [bacterium]